MGASNKTLFLRGIVPPSPIPKAKQKLSTLLLDLDIVSNRKKSSVCQE
jgi:hypothetical protein